MSTFNLPHISRTLALTLALGQALLTGAVPASALSFRDGLREGDRRLEQKQLELAQGCFAGALRDAKRDPSATADDRALCMEKLAAVLQMQDITEEAMPLYKKAIGTLGRAHGPNSSTLLPALSALGLLLELDGEYKKSIKVYSRAVRIAEADQSGGETQVLRLAYCLHDLGRADFKNGDIAGAQTNYRQSLSLLMAQANLPSADPLQDLISDYTELLEKKFGPARNLPSAVRNELLKDRLVDLPKKRGVAPSTFERAVTVRLAREVFDKMPADVLNAPLSSTPPPSLPAVADPDSAENNVVTAQKITFYERMVAVDIKSLGPEHPSVARDLSGLGAVYMAAGQYEDAKTVFMRALKIYETVYGADATLVKRTRSMLELVSENQTASVNGDIAGTAFVANLPPVPLAAQKLDIAISLNYLAALCFSLGKVEDAEKIYAWSVSDTYHTTGDRSLLLAAGLKDYARVLRTAGNTARAEVLEADARAIARRVLSQQAAGAYQ